MRGLGETRWLSIQTEFGLFSCQFFPTTAAGFAEMKRVFGLNLSVKKHIHLNSIVFCMIKKECLSDNNKKDAKSYCVSQF
jgi:hypothetical protein